MKKFLFSKIIILLAIMFSTEEADARTDSEGQLVHHMFDINNVPEVKAVAISPNGEEIWATQLASKSCGVCIFSVNDGKKITSLNLDNGEGVEIIFSKDGSKAYVSQMSTGRVFEIDVNTKKIVRIFKTKSSWTKVLEISPDGNKLYASNWNGNNISEFDLVSGNLIRNIKTIQTPRGIYVTKDGKYIYVAGFGRGEVQKINLIDNKKNIIFKSGRSMRHFAADEDKGVLYVSDLGRDTIFKIDLATDKVSVFAKTDSHPNTIALSPDKKILFVSNRGHNFAKKSYRENGPDWGSVLLFDTKSGKMLDAIIAGNRPTGLGVSKDGCILAFSDFLDARIEVFRIPAYEELLKGNGGRSKIYKKELWKERKTK